MNAMGTVRVVFVFRVRSMYRFMAAEAKFRYTLGGLPNHDKSKRDQIIGHQINFCPDRPKAKLNKIWTTFFSPSALVIPMLGTKSKM